MQETMTQAIRRAVTDTGTTAELAARLGERFGWTGPERAWRIRLSQMLSSGQPQRRFPADAVPDAIDVTGDLSILAPAHAAMVAVQARQAEEPRRHGPLRAPSRKSEVQKRA